MTVQTQMNERQVGLNEKKGGSLTKFIRSVDIIRQEKETSDDVR